MKRGEYNNSDIKYFNDVISYMMLNTNQHINLYV